MTETTFPSDKDARPSHAQVVTIGGGIIGCSVAYRLIPRLEGRLLSHGCAQDRRLRSQ